MDSKDKDLLSYYSDEDEGKAPVTEEPIKQDKAVRHINIDFARKKLVHAYTLFSTALLVPGYEQHFGIKVLTPALLGKMLPYYFICTAIACALTISLLPLSIRAAEKEGEENTKENHRARLRSYIWSGLKAGFVFFAIVGTYFEIGFIATAIPIAAICVLIEAKDKLVQNGGMNQ